MRFTAMRTTGKSAYTWNWDQKETRVSLEPCLSAWASGDWTSYRGWTALTGKLRSSQSNQLQHKCTSSMSFTSFPDVRMTARGVNILPGSKLKASAAAIYSSAAPCTQKLAECKTFLGDQHLFEFLVNSRGGRVWWQRKKKKEVGTHLASWFGGHREWCRA